MQVVQVGTDAPGADILHELIARPDIPYELEAIATTDGDLRGKKLGQTHLQCPSELDDVPFIDIIDAIEKTDAHVVFSYLEPKLVARYESRLAAGRLLIASGSASRERPEVPVVNAFVNPRHIDDLYRRPDMRHLEGKVIDTGTSLAAIISVPLAPLHRELGIRSMSVSSMQGWSDARMSTVPQLPAETQEGDTHAIEDDAAREELRSDTARLLGAFIGSPASGIRMDRVKLGHGHWVRGHYARIDLELWKGTDRKGVEELWRGFKAPDELDGARPQIRSITKTFGGKRWPGRYHSSLVKREHELLRAHTDPPVLNGVQPMRVQARVIESDPEVPTRLAIEVAGDNMVLGLTGGGLLNVIYARTQGYLD